MFNELKPQKIEEKFSVILKQSFKDTLNIGFFYFICFGFLCYFQLFLNFFFGRIVNGFFICSFPHL